jgi:hypothetical protein
MYFWNITKLKQQLIENGLTEKQLLYYILIFIALSLIGIEIEGYFPYTEPNIWQYVGSALNVFIPIIGTTAAFRGNGGNAGIKFAERYFSISFVVSIRFLALSMPLMLLMMGYWSFAYGLDGDKWPDSPDFFEVIIAFIFYVAMYARIVKHIADVAKATSSKIDENLNDKKIPI